MRPLTRQSPSFNPETDIPDRISIPVGDNFLHLTKDKVHGHWSVNYDKGQIPRELQGSWTSLEKVYRMIDPYLATKGVTRET